MEITITNKLRKIDSELITHLISICDEKEKSNISEKFFIKHNKINQDFFYTKRCLTKRCLTENFFETHFEKGFNFKWNYLCSYTFRLDHPPDKIISWLKSNPIYFFDNLIYKYL
jgi:hypothetical protein